MSCIARAKSPVHSPRPGPTALSVLLALALALAAGPGCLGESPPCRAGDLSCQPFALPLLYQSCPIETSWLRFAGSSSATLQLPLDVLRTSDGGALFVGKGNAGFAIDGREPVRAFTPPAGNDDLFLAKFTRQGDVLWHTFVGGAGNDPGDRPVRVVELSDGGFAIASSSDQSFGSPAGAFAGPDGNRDALLARVGSDGALLWHTYLGATGTGDAFQGVARLADGRILAAGSIDGGTTPATTPVHPHNGGGFDAGYAIYDSNGQELVSGFFGGAGSDDGVAATALDDGGFVLAVRMTGAVSASFGNELRAAAGGTDLLLAWFDANGVYRQHAFYGGTGTDEAARIFRGPAGSVLVIGTSDQAWPDSAVTPHSGAGRSDYFAARIGPSGNVDWLTFFDAGLASAPTFFGGGQDFDGGLLLAGGAQASIGSPLQPFNGGADMLLAKFSAADGAREWHAYYGGAGAGAELATGAAPACDGGYLLTGASQAEFGAPISAYPAGAPLGMVFAKLNSRSQF